MNKRNKILSGVFALTVGFGLAMPMTASANYWDHHHQHHEWRWQRENDHYRAYPSTPRYAYGSRPYAPLQANGQGMVNRRNPNLYWACDSDGHHCHWARR